MHMKAGETRRRQRYGVVLAWRWLLAISLVGLLLGCGGGGAPEPSSVDATSDDAPATTAPVQSPRLSAERAIEAIAAGERASREQRLFLPVADNAFELFLAALDADPGNERARLALQDLVPYAVLHIEQRLLAGDADEAERVLSLLRRAAGEAPALPRLQAALARLQSQQASERTAAEAAAVRQTPTVVPAPAPTLPAPAAPAPSVSSAPAPAAIEPTPPPAIASAAAPAQPSPSPAETPAAPAPANIAPAPVRVPDVVYRPALRYPPMAERRRIEGFVEIEFTITADGSVAQLEILRSEPEGLFDREALAAMERWRFAPPQAPLRARRTLEFKLAR